MVHSDGYVMKSESQFQYIQYEIKRTGPLRCYVSRSMKKNVAIIQAWHRYFTWRKISHRNLGAVSIRKTVLPGMAIPMLKIRRPNGRLIFNMEIAIRR